MDTGATFSLLPHKSHHPPAQQPRLIGPNGQPIRCWGEERLRQVLPDKAAQRPHSLHHASGKRERGEQRVRLPNSRSPRKGSQSNLRGGSEPQHPPLAAAKGDAAAAIWRGDFTFTRKPPPPSDADEDVVQVGEG